jgi:hypothetical protein
MKKRVTLQRGKGGRMRLTVAKVEPVLLDGWKGWRRKTELEGEKK